LIAAPLITRLPLAMAAEAHRIMQDRQTQGSLILVP